MEKDFLDIISQYKSVIQSWKKRGDVQDGRDTGWKPSKDDVLLPKHKATNIGYALSTTGYCVSASQSLLNDLAFQELLRIRFAKAKLISIDIKEQFYGFCKDAYGNISSQNKWHTAILVEDSGLTFVIDVTCGQFGNNFFNKDFWDFATWQETLRSPRCKHLLTDFNDNEINYAPKITDFKTYNKNYLYSEIFNNLHSQTNLTNNDRNIITDFLVNQLTTFNNKILSHTLTTIDYSYLKEVNQVLGTLKYNNYQKTYSVLEFGSKDSAKNWLNGFMDNQCKIDMYLLTFGSIENACKILDIDLNELNSKKQTGKFYVIFEFNNQFGIDLSEFFKYAQLIIPFNTGLEVTNVLNGIVKPDYEDLKKSGLEENELNQKVMEISENLKETDKLNTSWVIINNLK